MPRRPFLFTKTEMKRVIEVADEMGRKSVTMARDGVEITFDKDAREKPVEDKPKLTL